MLVFSVLLLMMVGAVFVYSSAVILKDIWGSQMMWILVIFLYYIIATLLPIDKIIGKVYPLFAFSLLFMAGALMIGLFLKWPTLPELWSNLSDSNLNENPAWLDFCLSIRRSLASSLPLHVAPSVVSMLLRVR